MPTGDCIADACGESSSASARHGSSGRIFVGDENSEQQENCCSIVATKARSCASTIKNSDTATEEAAMASASEFGGGSEREMLLGKMPGVDKKSSKMKAQLRHVLSLRGVQRNDGVQHFFVQRHKERRPGVLSCCLPQAAP